MLPGAGMTKGVVGTVLHVAGRQHPGKTTVIAKLSYVKSKLAIPPRIINQLKPFFELKMQLATLEHNWAQALHYCTHSASVRHMQAPAQFHITSYTLQHCFTVDHTLCNSRSGCSAWLCNNLIVQQLRTKVQKRTLYPNESAETKHAHAPHHIQCLTFWNKMQAQAKINLGGLPRNKTHIFLQGFHLMPVLGFIDSSSKRTRALCIRNSPASPGCPRQTQVFPCVCPREHNLSTSKNIQSISLISQKKQQDTCRFICG